MKMNVVDVVVKLDKIGQDVVRRAVTPAEVAILVAEHHKRAGGVPVTVIEGTEKEVEISGTGLYNILCARYGAKRTKNIYPSPTVRYPETVNEAIELGMATINPSEKLMEYEIN